MLPDFLVPEQAVSKDGEGPVVPLDEAAGKVLQITLGITEVIEQESLDILVFGSADGTTFGPKPLLTFPQKFYRGNTVLMLDLTTAPEVGFLRASWKVNRWGRGELKPMFTFYVVVSVAE